MALEGKYDGRLAFLKLSDDGGTTFYKLGHRNTMSINRTIGEIDVSDADSRYEEYLQGKIGETIDIEGFVDPGDDAQGILLDMFYNGTEAIAQWARKEESGEPVYEAKVNLTDFSDDLNDNEGAGFSASLRVAEQPTESTQA